MDLTGKRWNLNKRLFLIPALLALCCFANTLRYQFVYDDRFQIVEAAPVLQNWQSDNLKRLFDRDVWSFFCQDLSWEGKIRTPYYRPIFGLFVMINYYYSGLDPLDWHLTAIALHMIAAMLAYWLLLASLRAGEGVTTEPRYSEQEARWLALLGAACFAIHPAQSESVAWVAAYVNALSAIFIFGALLAYLRARRNVTGISMPWLLVGSGLYALALLTKEAAVIVPAIIAAYELLVVGRGAQWRTRLRRGILVSLPFLLLTFGYFALRIAIFGAVRPGTISVDFPEIREATRVVNFFTLPEIVLKYIKILVWPFALSPMYAVRYVLSPQFWSFFVPAIALAALSIAGAMAARRSVLVRIGLIWLIVPLLPMLDIRSFKLEDLVHDRYLYLSLAGAGLLFASVCRWFNAHLGRWAGKDEEVERKIAGPVLRPSVAVLTGVILAVMVVLTMKQNVVWADEWQLWTTAAESVPDLCTVNLELGRLNDEAARVSEALSYYERAKQVCPDSATVHYKLGLLYGRIGDLARSEEAFQRMAAVTSNRIICATAHFNLGVVYEKQGDLERAISQYQEGLVLNPASKNAAGVRQIIGELTAKLAQGKR